MKPKVRARAAERRSPRPWLYEICSSRWTTLRRHRQSDGEETDNCSRKKQTSSSCLSAGMTSAPSPNQKKIYDDIKSLIEILKEAVYVGFLSWRSCRGPTSKKCSLWSYQVEIREGQEENKPKDRNSKGWWCNVAHKQGYLAHAHHRIGK